jgi:hypothetical protein
MGLAGVAKGLLGRLGDDSLRALVGFGFQRTQRLLKDAACDPRAAQTARLLDIVGRHRDTVQGRALGLAGVRSLDDLRAKVPFSDWDSTAPLIERMVAGKDNVLVPGHPIYYATTSGTTGRRKLIPVTSEFVAECRVANRVLYRSMLLAMPGLIRGKRLSMRSPLTEKLSDVAEAGSITVALGGGVDDDNLLDAVPTAVFGVRDFALRYRLALRFALQERITVASAINPSTLHLYATTLAEASELLARGLDNGSFGVDDSALDGGLDDGVRQGLRARLRAAPDVARRLRESADRHGAPRMIDVFPELQGLVTWKGGASSWWLERLRTSYGDLPILDYGYAASEGCFGAPLSTDGADSVLLPHGHLLELLPEGETDPTKTVFLDAAEPGGRYEVIVTTSAGLVRYRMHDIVEITGRFERAPLAVFRHKAGTMCSITGEKLGEAHVATALAAIGFAGPGIVLSPHYPEAGGAPGYRAVVEAGTVADVDAFAGALDRALQDANEEMQAKRVSHRLAPLVIETVPAGAFAAHRRRRVEQGAPDAHVKTPLLSVDGALVAALRGGR